ncbi:RNA recognition motif [bacterium BMS3Bbin14]|nr:RNA recognition motif [bacterium BMS3Abin13]GBE53290.1 RNA recognition motif [bacterium BMS3Bbin14]HDO29722.1 RNA-binding protein [Desulfobacteraceae bacterium]
MNIYVGNLPYGVTDDELRSAFAEFGDVATAKIIMDRYSGRSKGFGFVEMDNDSEAEEAIKSLDSTDMQGRKLRVNQAKPRVDRPQHDSQY